MGSTDVKTVLLVTATILAVVYVNRKMGSPLSRLLPAGA